eukprot:6464326-Prymnesium_polylepis.2
MHTHTLAAPSQLSTCERGSKHAGLRGSFGHSQCVRRGGARLPNRPTTAPCAAPTPVQARPGAPAGAQLSVEVPSPQPARCVGVGGDGAVRPAAVGDRAEAPDDQQVCAPGTRRDSWRVG